MSLLIIVSWANSILGVRVTHASLRALIERFLSCSTESLSTASHLLTHTTNRTIANLLDMLSILFYVATLFIATILDGANRPSYSVPSLDDDQAANTELEHSRAVVNLRPDGRWKCMACKHHGCGHVHFIESISFVSIEADDQIEPEAEEDVHLPERPLARKCVDFTLPSYEKLSSQLSSVWNAMECRRDMTNPSGFADVYAPHIPDCTCGDEVPCRSYIAIVRTSKFCGKLSVEAVCPLTSALFYKLFFHVSVLCVDHRACNCFSGLFMHTSAIHEFPLTHDA